MLTNERIDEIAGPADYWDRRVFARAVEAAAAAPLLERIAALEAKLAQRVPDGWTLKPTSDGGIQMVGPNQIFAARKETWFVPAGQGGLSGFLHNFLTAMLSAAPAAPEQQSEPVPGVFVAGLGHQMGCSSHKSAHALCNCGYTGSAFVTVAQAPNAQQAELHGRPVSERAAELAADPVRGPRIEAMREKLAQQAEAQEPAFWAPPERDGEWHASHSTETVYRTPMAGWRPLFTRPQPAQLQALSEEEVRKAVAIEGLGFAASDIRISKAIQSALAAKNGAVLAVIKAKE